jgi:glycosyltransferase involved in cell wall biosynthesis
VPPGEPPAVTRQQLLAVLGLPAESRLVALVGRLWPQKRVKDAIWAADLLKVIRDDVHLLVIGDGPQRDRLRRYRDQCLIGDKVHFLGERGDVPRILPHCDVLWSTSGYEGQSNVILEAMAAGVPVVATDIPGTRELVHSGVTGYLVPVGRRAAFAKWTERLLDDAALAARLAAAARDRVQSEFSVEQMVSRHAELYREVLG